jgi:hypothetical protein
MNSGKLPRLISRGRRIAAPFVLAALFLSACVDSTPRIARDLPTNYPGVSPAFDKRVKEQFPIGSEENSMLNELQKENFRILLKDTLPSRFTSRATFTTGQIICGVMWNIQWSAASGKITAIQGSRGQTCF